MPMPTDQTIDFVIVFLVVGLLVLGIGSWLVGWLAQQWDRFVNRSAVVMSRSDDGDPPIAASSLQTRPDQTPDRPLPPRFTPELKLDTYRLLRKYGVPREEARPMLQAIGIGLDNNLWSKAQSPEPAQRTPIAGRPTDADFPFEPVP